MAAGAEGREDWVAEEEISAVPYPEGSLEASVAATEVAEAAPEVVPLATAAETSSRTCRSSSTDLLAARSSGLHSTE